MRIPAIERERWWGSMAHRATSGTWISENDGVTWRRIDTRRDDPRDFDQAEHDVDWIIDYRKGGEARSSK